MPLQQQLHTSDSPHSLNRTISAAQAKAVTNHQTITSHPISPNSPNSLNTPTSSSIVDPHRQPFRPVALITGQTSHQERRLGGSAPVRPPQTRPQYYRRRNSIGTIAGAPPPPIGRAAAGYYDGWDGAAPACRLLITRSRLGPPLDPPAPPAAGSGSVYSRR